MGSLSGLVSYNGATDDPQVLTEMIARQQHRGPNGTAAFRDNGVAIAHGARTRRSADQPVSDEALVLALDGWVHDVVAITEAPPASSDAAALLVGWRRYGPELLTRIEGEFAMAVWDRRSRALFLARDRLGVRPLHYARQGQQIAFASETQGVLAVPWVGREVEWTRIAEYLSFGVVHAPRTILRDVHQVEPGTVVRAEADGTHTKRYWTIRYAPPGTPKPKEGEVIEQLQDLVDAAVIKRVSEAPTGIFLSGGLGSSAIAAASRRHHLSLPAYTMAFSEDPFPEAPFAGRVAALLGIQHHLISLSSVEIADNFDGAVAAMGQPIGLSAPVLMTALARGVRSSVRVALSGDGGEELFGGRNVDGVAPSRLSSLLSRLPSAVKQLARRAGSGAGKGPLALGLGGADLFDVADRQTLLRDPALVRSDLRREVLEPWYSGIETDPVNLVLHGYLRSMLSEVGLTVADRAATACGLDVRFPLLDRAVVDAAAALPGSFKERRGAGSVHTRWPMRALLRGELPEVLLDRPKRGPPAPTGGWLFGHGRLFFDQRRRRLEENRFGLWEPAAITRLVADAERSNAGVSRVWSLFVLDSWLRHHEGVPS